MEFLKNHIAILLSVYLKLALGGAFALLQLFEIIPLLLWREGRATLKHVGFEDVVGGIWVGV